MKINEIIGKAPQRSQLQPSVVKRQARRNKIVAQIAANDQQQPPTEEEKVRAMWAYRDLKMRNDKTYAQRLRQQLANAEAALRSSCNSTAAAGHCEFEFKVQFTYRSDRKCSQI